MMYIEVDMFAVIMNMIHTNHIYYNIAVRYICKIYMIIELSNIMKIPIQNLKAITNTHMFVS